MLDSTVNYTRILRGASPDATYFDELHEPFFATPYPTPFGKIHDPTIYRAIAAVGKNNQISWKNELPWDTKEFKEDLQWLKESISDDIIIVGYKTYQSMPKHLLKKCRFVIVISKKEINDNNIEVAEDLDEALEFVEEMDSSNVWICGGESLYKEAYETGLLNEVWLSHIPYDGPADRYFPNIMESVRHTSNFFIRNRGKDNEFVSKVYVLKNYLIENYSFEKVSPGEIHQGTLTTTASDSPWSSLDSANMGMIFTADAEGARNGEVFINGDGISMASAGQTIRIADLDWSPSFGLNVANGLGAELPVEECPVGSTVERIAGRYLNEHKHYWCF